MTVLCLALGLVAFLIAVPLCALVRRWSLRYGLLDAAGSEAHKLAVLPEKLVPNTGGVAVFVAVAWPMLVVLLGVWIVPPGVWEKLPGGSAIVPHLWGLQSTSGIGGGILAGLAVMHVLGVVDDRRSLGPGLKLGVQVAVAFGLVAFCDIRVLSFLGQPEGGNYAGGSWYGLIEGREHIPGLFLSFAVSLLWIVVITNAMNFLDNMDGLAAGVGLVAAGLYLAATLIGGQWFVAALAALLCGALLGFLIFNFPPAKLYLGDGGSLVVGLLLAVISVRTTYVELGVMDQASAGQPLPGAGGEFRGGAWYGVLMPVLVLAVPLYDFSSVTLIRILNGKSPFTGDHNHFSHRLLRRGLTKRQVLAVILLAALATGLGGVMLGRLEGWQAAIITTQALAVLAMIALLEAGARR